MGVLKLQTRTARNPTVRLEREHFSSIELFISYPKMVSRCSRKFVFDISQVVQGFGHGPIFGHDSHMRTFKWRFLASQLSYRGVEPRNDHFKPRRSWHLPREHATIWGLMKFRSFFGRIGLQILDIFEFRACFEFWAFFNFEHDENENMMRMRASGIFSSSPTPRKQTLKVYLGHEICFRHFTRGSRFLTWTNFWKWLSYENLQMTISRFSVEQQRCRAT